MFPHRSLKIFMLGLFALAFPSAAPAGPRIMLEKPETVCLKVSFNGEKINAYYLLIDSRTEAEKERDLNLKRLSGPVTVFFQGHAQRPSDAYAFTSKLSRMSKSGIVVVPVCDTPYGINEKWRGDRGKDVVLMEVVRWALASVGIRVNGYEPSVEGDALVNGTRLDFVHGGISADLACVGWSHGGILARRIAHAYPLSVSCLAQVCPAGYEHWSPTELMLRFMGESLRVSRLACKGHAGDSLSSAWGFTRGFAGDFFRSIPSALVGHHPAKLGRAGKDIKDCSIYCDSQDFGTGNLNHIVVIFGDQDTCMDARKILACPDPHAIAEEQVQAFWDTYFSDTKALPARRTLAVLPGTHLAPLTHSGLYARIVLENLEQVYETSK